MWRGVILISCCLWTLTKAGAPCGLQMECVPKGLCKSGAWYQNAVSWQNLCQKSETCCHTSQMLVVGAPINCGRSNPNGLDATAAVAADQAKPHQFPWTVALMQNMVNFFGAGTLVTENVVITAAHLVQDKTIHDFVVVGGAWDINQLYGKTIKLRTVARIVVHPGFSNINGVNNIVLIVLAISYQITPHIAPICWPTPGVSFDWERCLVAGWGKQNPMATDYSHKQKRIELPVVSRSTCESLLRRTSLGPNFQLDASLLCAGGEKGRDACRGDGGSPLMCPIPGQPTLYEFAGIVNSGLSCGQQNVPALYTNISHMRPWIEKQLSDELNKPYRTFPIYDISYD
ncbi:phenoloxidase-activating factor 2-like [Drosophila teissieri]|uniref:phenoloxidase-activating factor 2-like n=1 Tax=Drosophila teissieri TaxID=7243 RepID=UPI001CBA4658|nr:phenoloxidase-activating factor 2-like [Drosophila teissieri]